MKLEFVLDLSESNFDQRALLRKYFSLTSGLGLIIEVLQKELTAGILDPKKHFDKQGVYEKLIMLKENLLKV